MRIFPSVTYWIVSLIGDRIALIIQSILNNKSINSLLISAQQPLLLLWHSLHANLGES